MIPRDDWTLLNQIAVASVTSQGTVGGILLAGFVSSASARVLQGFVVCVWLRFSETERRKRDVLATKFLYILEWFHAINET